MASYMPRQRSCCGGGGRPPSRGGGGGALVGERHHELRKQGVGPCEPAARETARVVGVVRLVHHARTAGGGHQLPQHIQLLLPRGACQPLSDLPHRPDIVPAGSRRVRAAKAADGAVAALGVCGVVRAQDEALGVGVHLRVRAVADVRDGHQAGDVGVVHQQVVAQPVHLVRVDHAVLRVLHDGVPADSLVDLGRQPLRPGRQLRLSPQAARQLRHVVEPHHRKHVVRHQVAVLLLVVAGAEGAPDHARVRGGGALALARQPRKAGPGVARLRGPDSWAPVQSVVPRCDGLAVLVPLLCLPDIELDIDSLEDRVIAQHRRPWHVFPVGPEQAEEVRARVELIVPGGDVAVAAHGLLRLAELVQGVHAEGVGVGVVLDVEGQLADEALK
mmetsp:Transcript_18698/g.47924  ORF Transcript_18698/g.47924 Transcript_18698/m.47924 type:complete len:388 (+) Transcript_18698:214-1377(+)